MSRWLKWIFQVPAIRRGHQEFAKTDFLRCATVLLVTISVGAGGLLSEEKLRKNGVTYLGWQTGNNQFTTCGKKTVSIENGKIDETPEKCPKEGGPDVAGNKPITLIGTVAAFDVQARTVDVKDSKGEVFKLFVPASAEKGTTGFQNIRLGESVTMSVPVPGRADKIKWNAAYQGSKPQ
jgi:hypothetical protein